MKKCFFCQIVAGKIREDYLYEDDRVIVHSDIHPRARVHLLITTRKRFDDFAEMMAKEPELLAHIGKVVEIVVDRIGLKEKSYTWGFHSGAKQSVKHCHAQLLSVDDDELVL